MEEAQDRRTENYKDMSCETILALGEARTKSLRGLTMRKKVENLGGTDYDIGPSRRIQNWNTSKNSGTRTPTNVSNKSSSSDEMNLRSGDVVFDGHPAANIPSSSSIDSQSSSSISSSSSDETSSHYRVKGKSFTAHVSKPSIQRSGYGDRPVDIPAKGKAKNQGSEVQLRNLPMDKANRVESKAPVKKLKSLPLLDHHIAQKGLTKDSIPSKHKPFPMGSSSLSPKLYGITLINGESSRSNKESLDEESDDPLRSNANDEIVNRGGLRPFPMSSQGQDRSSSKKKTTSFPSNNSKRESETEEETNAMKRRRRSSEINDISLADMSFDEPGSLARKGNLCPYCDMLLPENPSPSLQRMLNDITTYRPDPRPSNPNGRKAPLLSYINICQRHQFEVELLPKAEAAGWPTYIDFNLLPSRIAKMREKLKRFLDDRTKSQFWVDAEKQLGGGSRKAHSIAGQLSVFEKCQPGYYGEQGFVIIYRTLSTMFPPETMDAKRVEPLSPSDFIQRVLVPECALALIKADSEHGASTEDALRIMHASSKFGSAMYPDMDTSGGVKDASAGSSGHGVGEAMVKEQARKNATYVTAEQAHSGQNVRQSDSHSAKASRIQNSTKAAKTPQSHDAKLIELDSDEGPGPKAAQRRQRKQMIPNVRKGVKARSCVISTSDEDDEEPAVSEQRSSLKRTKNNSWLLDCDSDSN